jgi:hypothetical protein
VADTKVRPCGLYRTTIALGDSVPADILVMFHNHSDEGPPVVQVPHSNRNNRWHFHGPGVHLHLEAEVESLVELKAEGFYFLREHFHPDNEHVVAERSLVQLGYNREAEPIIFFPRTKPNENALEFPRQGVKIPSTIYDLLEPLDVRGPRVPPKIH